MHIYICYKCYSIYHVIYVVHLSQNALLVHSGRAVSIAASVKTRHHVTMWAELVPVILAGLERSVKNVQCDCST